MRTFLTNEEIIELAMDRLNLCRPNPDRIPDIAQLLDMVYNEEIDMYEDVEGYYVSMCIRLNK